MCIPAANPLITGSSSCEIKVDVASAGSPLYHRYVAPATVFASNVTSVPSHTGLVFEAKTFGIEWMVIIIGSEMQTHPLASVTLTWYSPLK